MLITSLLECPGSRSVYNRKHRFEQTKQTIDSVKKHIRDAYIILIDCTEMNEEESTYFHQECNVVLDCSKQPHILQKVYGPHKSDGERSYLLHVLQHLEDHQDTFKGYKHFFKLSGRYWLDDNFDFSKYDIPMDVISTVDPKLWEHACVSCLFKLAYESLPKFKQALLYFQSQFEGGMCTEHFLYHYVYSLQHQAFNLQVLGCGGNIAINGIEGHC